MSVEFYHTKREAEWHALRSRDVTASQAGGLWPDGFHDYTDRFRLYHTKRGTMPPGARSANEYQLRRGRIFEQAAVNWLRHDHPDWTIHYDPQVYSYYRDTNARIGATPDVRVDHPTLGPGVIQIKTVGRPVFRRKWIDEDGDLVPPGWIILQAEIERHLTGSEWAAVAALVSDEWDAPELPLFKIPEQPGLIDDLKRRSVDFWRDVEAGNEPPTTYQGMTEFIDGMYPDANPDNEIDLTESANIKTLLDQRAIYAGERRAAQSAMDAIDAEIKHRMGTATVAHIGEGRRITWRNERREGRSFPPTNQRVLRVPTPKES